MFGRMAAGLVHDLSHPIQNIGNSTRLLLRDDVDAESRDMFRRTIERELATLKRFMDDLRQRRQAEADRALRDGRQRVGRRDRRRDARRRRAQRRGVDGQLRRGAAGHRRRSLCARPRVPQPHHQRDSGDRAGRARRRSRPARVGAHVEISVTDTGSGIPPERLAAIFDDFVTTKRAGPRARPGDLEAHRRTARRHDRRRERSGTRHVPSRCVSRRATIDRRRRRQVDQCVSGDRRTLEAGMFRTLVKTDVLRSKTRLWRCGISSCGRCAAHGATAPRSSLAPGDRIILDDDSVMNLEARTTCLVPATLYSRLLRRPRRRPPDRHRLSGRRREGRATAENPPPRRSQTS